MSSPPPNFTKNVQNGQTFFLPWISFIYPCRIIQSVSLAIRKKSDHYAHFKENWLGEGNDTGTRLTIEVKSRRDPNRRKRRGEAINSQKSLNPFSSVLVLEIKKIK